MPSFLSGFDIICFAQKGWDAPWGAPQQMMSRLSSQNRIFYINRPMSLLSPITGSEDYSVIAKVKDSVKGIRKISTNLFVCTPPVLLPLRFLTIPERINTIITKIWLDRLIKNYNISSPIFWTFQPESARLVGQFKECLSIYHCVDEWSARDTWWNPPALVRRKETQLIAKADLVITTSLNLQKKKSLYNPKCFLVPGAADFDLFFKAQAPQTEVHPDLSYLPKPIIGYIGMLGPQHIDVDLLVYVATKSRYTFIFIGRKTHGFFDLSRLAQLENIHFLGFKESRQLPSYIKGMDVCIMPFKKCDWIEAASPLKLYEYLAAGKPVVSIRTEELTSFSNVMKLVETPEEFLHAIDSYLAEDQNKNVAARIAVARKNTWEARIETISEIIQTHLAKE